MTTELEFRQRAREILDRIGEVSDIVADPRISAVDYARHVDEHGQLWPAYFELAGEARDAGYPDAVDIIVAARTVQ